MKYAIGPGAIMEFFNSEMQPIRSVPAAEYELPMWDGTIYETPFGTYVLIYNRSLGNGAVYMGIKTNSLMPVAGSISARSFQSAAHQAACDAENNMRAICGHPQYVSGPVKYAACVAKCTILHPFNKTKRDACKAACAVLLSAPDDGAQPDPLPQDPPPVKPPKGSNILPPVPVKPPPFLQPSPVGVSFEIFTLDDLKFIYTKIKNFFTNK